MIEFKNIDFYYTKQDHALKNVSFSIKDKEWVSIIGHNGSGKSTISKLLVGLLKAQRGHIYYNCVELNEETVDDIRKNVGIVFQNPDNQFVGFNVKYDMAFGLENHQVPREEMISLINEYAEKVDMDKFLLREPHTLSGGQKQRVAIAGILAMNCDVVILDEATSMLDPEGTEEIINLIKELKDKYQKTIITITHDLKLANMSDRVLVMKNGELINEGLPADIFKDEDLLQSSNLDMPFSLKVYSMVKKDEVLSKDERLVNALWQYHLKA